MSDTPALPDKKIYKEKPELGPVSKKIKEMKPEKRQAQHHLAVVQAVNEIDEFTLWNVRVVPTSPVHIDPVSGFVEIRCFAFDATTGEEIPHMDGRFQFVEPSLVVPDGTFHKESVPVRGENGETLVVEQDVPNVVEDIPEAIRRQLVRLIRSVAGMSPEV